MLPFAALGAVVCTRHVGNECASVLAVFGQPRIFQFHMLPLWQGVVQHSPQYAWMRVDHINIVVGVLHKGVACNAADARHAARLDGINPTEFALPACIAHSHQPRFSFIIFGIFRQVMTFICVMFRTPLVLIVCAFCAVGVFECVQLVHIYLFVERDAVEGGFRRFDVDGQFGHCVNAWVSIYTYIMGLV
jgi:hypothetical protein